MTRPGSGRSGCALQAPGAEGAAERAEASQGEERREVQHQAVIQRVLPAERLLHRDTGEAGGDPDREPDGRPTRTSGARGAREHNTREDGGEEAGGEAAEVPGQAGL